MIVLRDKLFVMGNNPESMLNWLNSNQGNAKFDKIKALYESQTGKIYTAPGTNLPTITKPNF